MREIRQPGEYTFLFGTYAEPVAAVTPGETVIIYTADAFENLLTSEDQHAKDVRKDFLNPQTGPIYVEGAEPGDTLKVEIIEIESTRNWGWSALAEKFGGLNANVNTPMLNEPLKEKTWVYKIEDGWLINSNREANPALKFRMAPFIGTMGTAPVGIAVSSLVPFDHGGNMDCPDVKAGNILYFPVSVEGAYYLVGDVHAKQGHGEICGSAIEIPAKLTLKFDVIKKKKIKWPRIENQEWLMCVGSAKPLEDAVRIAGIELLDWMVELGWNRMEAYQCITMEMECYLASMVNPSYTMVARIPREIAYRCFKPE